MLNDRQLFELGLNDYKGITYTPSFPSDIMIIVGDYRGVPSSDDIKKWRVSKRALRAMLEDYLERLEEWKEWRVNFNKNNIIPGFVGSEKRWLKSRKAILEKGLNKTWPEIRQILEENK